MTQHLPPLKVGVAGVGVMGRNHARVLSDIRDFDLANRADADVRDQLPGGTVFNVLDMAGGWAWGQVGDDGFVGYLPVEALENESPLRVDEYCLIPDSGGAGRTRMASGNGALQLVWTSGLAQRFGARHLHRGGRRVQTRELRACGDAHAALHGHHHVAAFGVEHGEIGAPVACVVAVVAAFDEQWQPVAQPTDQLV